MELHSEKIDLILPALIAAKGKFTAAKKDTENAFFKSKYATLDTVIDAVNGALLEQQIAIIQPTVIREGATVLVTRFYHVSGQWIGSEYPVYAVKKDPQGEGSALTYARRYALMALAGIAPEDDDGNAATKTIQSQKKTPPVSAGKPQDGMRLEDMNADRQATIKDYAEAVSEYCKAGDVSAAAMEWRNCELEHEEKAAMWGLLASHERSAIKRYLDNN